MATRIVRNKFHREWDVTEAVCDRCSRLCPGAQEAGSSDWSASVVDRKALEVPGWELVLRGRLQQLLCPSCVQATPASLPPVKLPVRVRRPRSASTRGVNR